ncbi:MAG: putative outer membrane protein [Bacteroidetes bacterium]|nr:putative outer membrane protein [Bacteroidota bacterium]
MKSLNLFNHWIVKCMIITALGFNLTSCKNENKKEDDSKDIANKFNDAKFHNSKEAKFLVDATEISFEEIEIAHLAVSNGTNDNIKDIAKLMEKDHNEMLEEMKKIAQAKDITLPTEITAEGQKERKRQAEKSGTEFDKHYCETVVENHKKAVKKYMAALEDCEDVEVKNYATKTLVTLRSHIDQAMSCSLAYKETKHEPENTEKTLDNNMKDAKEHPAAKTVTHSNVQKDSEGKKDIIKKDKDKEPEAKK